MLFGLLDFQNLDDHLRDQMTPSFNQTVQFRSVIPSEMTERLFIEEMR